MSNEAQVINNEVQLVVFEHPFKAERRIIKTPSGRIGDLIASCRSLPDGFRYSLILNDRLATLDDEAKAGDTVIVRAVPAGTRYGETGSDRRERIGTGVGKIGAGTGLIFLGGTLAAGSGGLLGGVGWFIASLGVTLVGNGISLLLPQVSADGTKSAVRERPGLSGAQNRAKPDGKLPFVLGTHLLTPYYACSPYTSIAARGSVRGGDLYVNFLFALAYSPLGIEDLKAGDVSLYSGTLTPNATFTGNGPYSGVTGNFRNGTIPSEFPFTVIEQQIGNTLSADDYFIVGFGACAVTVNATAKTLTFAVGVVPETTYHIKPGIMVRLKEASNVGNQQWAPVVNVVSNVVYLAGDTPGLVNESVLSTSVEVAAYNMYVTSEDTTRITTCVTFPQGFCMYRKDSKTPEEYLPGLTFKAVYRLKGTSTWNDFSSPFVSGDWTRGWKTETTTRLEAVANGLTSGQYEVMVMRLYGKPDLLNGTYAGFTAYDTLVWSYMQSGTQQPVVNAQDALLTSFLYLKVKATTALSGSLGLINCVATASYLESVTGKAYTESNPNNPASSFLYALTGVINPRPVTDKVTYIDYDSIDAWYNYCEEMIPSSVVGVDRKRHTCNAVVDTEMNLKDLLNRIAGTGRAYMTLRDGKYSVVWDAVNPTVVQHITPRNSWGFQGSKLFEEIPRLMRVKYIDADAGWKENDEDVYGIGYNAGSTPRVAGETWGLTNHDEVWSAARYALACFSLRPESFSVTMDAEQLACTLGDRVELSHDAMLVGLAWGRIKTVTDDGTNVTEVTLDEPVAMSTGTSYGLRLRNGSGGLFLYTTSVVTEDGTHYALVLDPLEGTCPLVGEVEIGDLFQFGVAGYESFPCTVTGIRMNEDLSAQLDLIPYNEAVFDADESVVPAYVPLISRSRTQPVRLTDAVEAEIVRDGLERPTSELVPTSPKRWDDGTVLPTVADGVLTPGDSFFETTHGQWWTYDGDTSAWIREGIAIDSGGDANVASSTYDGPWHFKCDGTADDVQIQEAIDYLTAIGGGYVRLTAGTYNITTAINLKAGVMLDGVGVNTHLVTTSNINLIKVTGAGAKVTDCKLTGKDSASYAAVQVDAANFTITGCVIENTLKVNALNCDAVGNVITSNTSGDYITGTKLIKVTGSYLVAASTYTGEYTLKCDGVADAYEILKLMSYVSTYFGGGEVRLSEGLFVMDDSGPFSEIDIPSNVTLRGAGTATVIRPRALNCIFMTDVDGAGLRDLTIDAYGMAVQSVIDVTDSTAGYANIIDNIKITGCAPSPTLAVPTYLIKSTGTYRNTIVSNCVIDDCIGATGNSIAIGIYGASTVYSNRLGTFTGFGTGYGIGIASCRKCSNNSVVAASTAKYGTVGTGTQSYADSGTANACADTYQGGFNS